MSEETGYPRCGPTEPESVNGLDSIQIEFSIPVSLRKEHQHRLIALMDEIVALPENQLLDGVHWVSFIGGRLEFGADPREEPECNDSVFVVSSVARHFVSDKEKARVEAERLHAWKKQ